MFSEALFNVEARHGAMRREKKIFNIEGRRLRQSPASLSDNDHVKLVLKGLVRLLSKPRSIGLALESQKCSLNRLVDLKTAGVFRTSTGEGAEWIRNGGVIKFGRQGM